MQDADRPPSLPTKPVRARPLPVAPAIPPKCSSYTVKEVHWEHSAAVRVGHLMEFLRGEMIFDSRCTNRDLLCFTLHMIMMDTGYQPTAPVSLTPSPTDDHTFTYTLPHLPQSQPITMTCSTGSHFFSTIMNKEIHNSSGQRLKSWDEKYIITLNVVKDNFSFNERKTFLDVFVTTDLLPNFYPTCFDVDYWCASNLDWTVPSDVIYSSSHLVQIIFKDCVSQRLLTDIHRVHGITETGTFTSLLPELKFAVMRLLDARSLLSLSATCKLMQSLALNRVLWLSLLKKDLWQQEGQLVPRPLDIMNIRKRTDLHLYPQLYKMDYNRLHDKLRNERLKRQGLFNQYHRHLRKRPPWIKAPHNRRHGPLPPVLSNNRHGYRKRPLTPPPRSRFKYHSSLPYSLDRNRPILFSHRSNTMLTLAGNDNGYYVYYNEYPLQRSHSFPTLPCDKWQHYWQ